MKLDFNFGLYYFASLCINTDWLEADFWNELKAIYDKQIAQYVEDACSNEFTVMHGFIKEHKLIKNRFAGPV